MAEIVLTPEMLIAQSTQMQTLAGEFESLFSQTTTVLHGMNDSWSENIATNFVSKILLAQQSFSSITNMLNNGSAAAKFGALSFQDGINMGDLLDAMNGTGNIYDSSTNGDYSDIYKEIYGDSYSYEGEGNIIDNYKHGLGGIIEKDYNDLRDMILGDKPVESIDVAKKYVGMLWHYGPGGVIKAEAKTFGLDSGFGKQVVSDVGEVYASITGDAGARDYFNHYYDNGYENGIVGGIMDIVDYVKDEAPKNVTIGQLFRSVIHK